MAAGLRAERLLTRATFGPRPGDIERVRHEGPDVWLHRQLTVEAAMDATSGGPKLVRRTAASRAAPPGMTPTLTLPATDAARRKHLRRRARETAGALAGARLVRAVHGTNQVHEVMVDFWANHFNVFGRKSFVGTLLPQYQRDVLDTHALGRFEDLLLAVARSPAMLVYLDNWLSTARPSADGRDAGRHGINENYARELLELHTLGINGGYTQGDVTETARVFSGWTLESLEHPVFHFDEQRHDMRTKVVLGRRIGDGGEAEGAALLGRLARHPSTARHVSRKLVKRFVADDAPPALVDRTTRRFLDADGDLREVLAFTLGSPEFVDADNRKLKTPLRFVAGALRATDGETDGSQRALTALGRLGEVPFGCRVPTGFPEDEAQWIDPGAVLERMRLAFALADERIPGTRLGPTFPDTLDPHARAFAHAGSATERVALAIASPEFQWA